MFRKLLIGYLVLLIACKTGSFTYLYATGHLDLPLPVLISSAGVLLLALVLLVKECTRTTRRRDFTVFFLVSISLTLFNLFYTAMASPLRVTAGEMVLIGSFTDIIVALAFFAAVFRGRNYVTIRDYDHKGESPKDSGESPESQAASEGEKPGSTV